MFMKTNSKLTCKSTRS